MRFWLRTNPSDSHKDLRTSFNSRSGSPSARRSSLFMFSKIVCILSYVPLSPSRPKKAKDIYPRKSQMNGSLPRCYEFQVKPSCLKVVIYIHIYSTYTCVPIYRPHCNPPSIQGYGHTISAPCARLSLQSLSTV